MLSDGFKWGVDGEDGGVVGQQVDIRGQAVTSIIPRGLTPLGAQGGSMRSAVRAVPVPSR